MDNIRYHVFRLECVGSFDCGLLNVLTTTKSTCAHVPVNLIHIKGILFAYKHCSYRAVSTVNLCYKNQSVNAV